MKFALATLYVTDMEKSLYLYNKILEIPITRRQPIGNGKEMVFLGADGEPNLELIPADEPIAYSGFSIGFTVDNMDAIKKTLTKNNYTIKSEMPVGESSTICFFDGPNGETIELIEW